MSGAPLWTIAEVARALGLSGNFPDTAIDFVTQDSRLVKPGSLFVALSGLVTLLTINNWRLASYGFPIYLMVTGMLLFLLTTPTPPAAGPPAHLAGPDWRSRGLLA